MRRNVPFVAMLSLLLLLNVGWGRKKEKYEIDKAALAGVKRVAVFSVYGPSRHSEGLEEKVDLQPFADSAEQIIAAALAQGGFEVVPLAETKAAFQRDYADAFADALATTTRQRDREKVREMVRAAGVQNLRSPLGMAVPSRNTSFVFGTDEPGWGWELYYTVDDAPVLTERGESSKAEHSKAAVLALGTIAKSLGADGFVVARIRPTTATIKNESSGNRSIGARLNPLTAVRDSVKTLKSGEWGANILDFDLFDTRGATVFSDQVIARSKEEVGNVGTGFKVSHGIGATAATALMKEALDTSISTAFLHLTGKELAPTTPGLGVEGVAEAKARAADAAAAAAAEAPARAAAAAGVYQLTTMVGKPLPYKNDQGFVYEGGTLELRSDGTFVSSTTMGGGKKSNFKGTYTITGDEIAFKAEGNAFTRMFAPSKGRLGADSITVHPGDMAYRRTP